MTDNKIIKALECCIGDIEGKNCFECPLYEIDDCQNYMYREIFDLINRQKATIKKLKSIARYESQLSLERAFEIKKLQEEKRQIIYDRDIACGNLQLKEFAERCKDLFPEEDKITRERIDNLLKEMVGEGK